MPLLFDKFDRLYNIVKMCYCCY